MNNLDTLKIWVDYSACTEQAYERLEVIKIKDSILIKSAYKDSDFDNRQSWSTNYIKTISVNDTIWGFEKFLKKNSFRLKSDTQKYGRIQLQYKKQKLHFFSDGLGDIARFLRDYNKVMLYLNPQDSKHVYAVVPEIE